MSREQRQLIKCDKCGDIFPIKIKKRQLGNGIEQDYFTCKSCGSEYFAGITDYYIRNMTQNQSKLIDKLNQFVISDTNASITQRDELAEKYKANFDKMVARSKELKEKYLPEIAEGGE